MNPHEGTPVLRYARYMGPDTESIYGHVQFCGSCKQHLGGSYSSPLMERVQTPADIEAECEAPLGSVGWNDEREYVRWAYCPFCGVAFAAEWWRDQPVQNERAIDHYHNPGSHNGDCHEFAGFTPAGHILGSTAPTATCWCDPEITPDLLGCTIKHRDVECPYG